MKCKVCQKEFHYCNSCERDEFMEIDYCSEACYMQSEEYRLNASTITEFIYSLTDEQLQLFEKYDMIDDELYPNWILAEECIKNKKGEVE